MASRCIARGDLDRAEALLDQISNTHRDKRELLSALRRKQGRTEEAWTLLEPGSCSTGPTASRPRCCP